MTQAPGADVSDVAGTDLERLVGAPRFELGTPCTPCKCATRLRHAPTLLFLLTTDNARWGMVALSLMIRRFARPRCGAFSGAGSSSALQAPPVPVSRSAGSASHPCALLRQSACCARHQS